MNYLELRTLFKGYLLRGDCDDVLADQFINMGLTRIERLIRTPLQSSSVSISVTAPTTFFMIPTDLLAIISLKVNGVQIPRESESTFTPGLDAGYPVTFAIKNGQFAVSPAVADLSVLEVNYYAGFAPAANETDTTNYTTVISDLVIFQALVFASIYFVDDRQVNFQNMAMMLQNEIEQASSEAKMSGGMAMVNPYEGLV
jgi:hypothetical protein